MCGALERVVDVPDVSAERVGGALQRPGEERQLPAETGLVELLRVGVQERQVIGQSAQGVIATAVKHVTERRLDHRNVLRQEVVFHLCTINTSVKVCFDCSVIICSPSRRSKPV